jgi:hypothetical protein
MGVVCWIKITPNIIGYKFDLRSYKRTARYRKQKKIKRFYAYEPSHFEFKRH